MAQESQVERQKSDANNIISQNNHLNVQAVEDALAEGLAKVPIVKKVLCTNEGRIFNLIIVHNSSDIGTAIHTIVNRMVDIEYQVIQSGDAPENIYFDDRILRESPDRKYGEWGEKILFERK